ncbi:MULTISPECIES: ribosomal protein S18-alanine N-acetyltransferase [Halomonadaceae]|uniref:ribosomal protein S18-alanine N-acetyltransferase n=1 Tax=Halomonadaceae TaxID=28256 RepID=UPI001597FCFE|nr:MULTISPECIES: ribosomal protein S18-alanine N-acetyltransferase [Halomonas]QJQ94594.1 ribosomal protein S18-alanine N-acetyltransferase [Halomonas sp. PA5]
MTEAQRLALQALNGRYLAELAALERLGQRYPWSEGQLAKALDDADTNVWGALAGEGYVLGFAVLCRLPFDAELQAITVAPAARRQGIAGALLVRLEQQARAWGSERLLLEVRESNTAAIALYRGHGFVEDGRRRGYYPALAGQREDALLMSRPLI